MLLRGAVTLLALGISTMASAQTLEKRADSGRKVGVGIAFIGPMGLSLYGDVDSDNFVQGAVAFGEDADFAATADYAFAYRHAIEAAPSITPYWGVGAIGIQDDRDNSRFDVDERDETYVGGRIPLGANWVIPSTPIQLGAEIAPTLLVAPATYAYVQGGMNIRVLF